MISIIQKAIENRLWVLIIAAAVTAAGAYSLVSMPIDAVPDITPAQVVINTRTGALDPERVEKTVTYYIESEMAGLPRVREVRSLSRFGLSQVVVIFEDDTDIYRSRQLVVERLQNVRGLLPGGVSPELGALSTGLGEVVFFTVKAKNGSALSKKGERERLTYLRTVTDFIVRPYLKAKIKNVADIDVVGGYKKEIHIDVDPGRLVGLGLTFDDVIRKLDTLGESYGGGYIQKEGRQVVVRTLGTPGGLPAIRNMPVRLSMAGAQVPLSRIAVVREGYAQRLGVGTLNGEEAVLGTVFMLLGANSREVATDAVNALARIPLPPDVEVEAVYNRTFLVNATISTVAVNLAEGAALVVLVLLLVLGNLRASLVVSLAIPLSMLAAAVGMRFLGISANLMSLGAVDFGLLVDASVVIVENIIRRLEGIDDPARLSAGEKLALVREASGEVLRPVVYGLLIIMAVYVPILSLEGIEGKLFHPMAVTVLMALGASLAAAVFIMPVLALVFLVKAQNKREPVFFRLIHRMYAPALRYSLRHRAAVLAAVFVIMSLAASAYFRMGSDFLPQLDEGDMSIGLVREPGISMDETLAQQRKAERIVMDFPEVERVFARTGVSESAADPMGHYMSDMFIILKKNTTIREASGGKRRTKGDLFNAIKARIVKELPEQEIMASQPIELRFNEILEGSRADVSLRIYGPDLDRLFELQNEAREILEKVPGASEVELDALTALRKGPFLNVAVDYGRINRYGVQLKEVNETVETAMGGREVGGYYEYDWRFPVMVRMASELRDSTFEISRIPVPLPDGGSIQLKDVCRITMDEQINNIAREGARRYAAVAVNLEGGDISGFVDEAKRMIRSKMKLPPGYHLEWGGQFRNLERAGNRLAVVIPAAMIIIFFFILRTFGSMRQAFIVYTAIPFAATGGIFALALRGMNMSVSAGVGFIALTGVAILNGLVLVSYINGLRGRGMAVGDAVREGCYTRLRPVVMTALVASLGFLPMALNTGLGAEVQRPLATVVIGGLVTSTALTLIILPLLYEWLEGARSTG
jgi:cobalt-zinc-cadmium resistance protein CzcA